MKNTALGGICGGLLAAGGLSLTGHSPGLGLLLAGLWVGVLSIHALWTDQP